MKSINRKLVRRKKRELLSDLIKLMMNFPDDWRYNDDATLIEHKKNDKTYNCDLTRDLKLYKLSGIEIIFYFYYAEIRINDHKEHFFYWPDIFALRSTAKWLRKKHNTYERLMEISRINGDMKSIAYQ